MKILRYWIADALYWLAEKIDPAEDNFVLHELKNAKDIIMNSNKPTDGEIQNLRDLLNNSK